MLLCVEGCKLYWVTFLPSTLRPRERRADKGNQPPCTARVLVVIQLSTRSEYNKRWHFAPSPPPASRSPPSSSSWSSSLLLQSAAAAVVTQPTPQLTLPISVSSYVETLEYPSPLANDLPTCEKTGSAARQQLATVAKPESRPGTPPPRRRVSGCASSRRPAAGPPARRPSARALPRPTSRHRPRWRP